MRKNKIPHINEDDYLGISEFAKAVGIPKKRLQFYDDLGIIVPAMRNDKNYRKYSPMQITTVKMAKVLRDAGVHLENIATLEHQRTPKAIANVLAQNIDSIDSQIQHLTDIRAVSKSYHKMITEGMSIDEDEITVRILPELPLTLGDPTVFDKDKSFFNDYLYFCFKPRNPALNLNYAIGGYFESMESFIQHPSKPDRFYSLDPDGGTVRENGEYLIGYTRGYYGTTNDLPQRMLEYAQQHCLTFDGPVYNIFIQDELCITDPNNYLLKVSASIKGSGIKSYRHFKRETKREPNLDDA